jgi:hypothetical protein
VSAPAPLRRAVALAALAAGGLAGAAALAADAPLQPTDFAYGYEIRSAVPLAAAYRLALPYEVYRQRVRADFGDLRVFNADGQLVPYEIRRDTLPAGDARPWAPLPLYALRGDPRRAVDAVRLRLEAGGAALDLATSAPAGGEAPVTSYIVDARAYTRPIARLRVQWTPTAASYTGALIVEAGDDLTSWRRIGSGSVANLSAAGSQLVANEIELGAASGRYLRLSWAGAPPPFVLERAEVQAPASAEAVPRARRRFAGRAVDGAAGSYDYDLGAPLPVDRIALDLPELNTVARLRVQWRGEPGGEWSEAGTITVYRLAGGEGDGELRNPPLSPGLPDGTAVRALRFTVLGAPGTLGATVPALEAGWVAHELRFIGRGRAPFTLAVGSARIEGAQVPLADLLAGSGGEPLPVATASVGEPRELGGAARLAPPLLEISPRNLVLWLVLLAGVAALGYMATRLLRDLKR